MKLRIIAFILCSSIWGNLSAQKVKLNERTSIAVKTSGQQLNSENLKSIARSKGIKTLDLPNSDNKYSYLQDEVIVTITSSILQKKVNLVLLKADFDKLGEDKYRTYSKIIKEAGREYLIIEKPLESKIWIFCTNPSGSALANCVLEFKEEHRMNAQKLVRDVLNSIEMK